MQSQDIRTAFQSFFKRHHHHVIPSGSLIPDDPTLLFTSAGMVPLKDYFLNLTSPPHKRLTSIQQCLRAGGKHNDLDEVGKTPRHHTFFEMCGNFSIGDYFKEEAISLAHDFIWKTLRLDPKRLYVTVYAEDSPSYEIWSKLIPNHSIIPISTHDNFWSMGDSGPCGPCTEIFYDQGESMPGGLPGTPTEDGPRFMEIWNLVFMQYNKAQKDGETILSPLEKKSVDTGMGLERITAVMEGVVNNFDTDLFQPLIHRVSHITGKDITFDKGIHHRILADHIRAAVFLINEGLTPGREGHSYVLRRIIRRAILHANILSDKQTKVTEVLTKMVPTLIQLMHVPYPKLQQNQAFIEEQLNNEERLFQKTLHDGLKLLEKELQNKTLTKLSGKTAFTLYETYGFPIDLTQQILESKHINVNMEEFQRAMENHKRKSSNDTWKAETSSIQVIENLMDRTLSPTTFMGYTHTTVENIKNRSLDFLENKTTLLVLDKTPFYPESGGQIGDRGEIWTPEGLFKVTDTQKTKGGVIYHKGHLLYNKLIPLYQYTLAIVNITLRTETAKHHSAVHLLHKTLQERFGAATVQQGSWVGYNRARLDFSYSSTLTYQDIVALEKAVNAQIQHNSSVITKEMSYDDALKTGAMALFGEKYDEMVRVVQMGKFKNNSPSIELCGGTHIKHTGDIGIFIITKSEAVKSGVKRIEFSVGLSAIHKLQKQKNILNTVSIRLNTSTTHILDRIEQLTIHQTQPKEPLFSVTKEDHTLTIQNPSVHSIPMRFIMASLMPAKQFKGYVDNHAILNGVTLLINQQENKTSLVVKSLIPKISAEVLIKILAKQFQGKGGGRYDLAQAGFQTQVSFKNVQKAFTEILKTTEFK